MTRFFRSCSIALALSIISIELAAQSQFDKALETLETNFPQEKLYLHFDREAYNPGEVIWFKAYLFSGVFPSPYSKTIYAELVDANGKVIDRKKAPVFNGGASAAFDIPATINEPSLFVRAYTAWMLNFDSSFIYTREIPLLNVQSAAPKKIVKENHQLNFFPEGGDLVENIQSKLAFKANNSRGLPIAVNGVIKNNKGETITDFTSVHNGMGYLFITPKAGEQYTAEWKDSTGKTYKTPLPKASKNGVVLEVNTVGTALNFKLSRREGSPGASYFVVAQMQQQLLYRAKANLEQTTVITGTIPLNELPAGIIQVTVFTENNLPLAERIVFVRPNDYYFITDLNLPLKAVNKRGRNVMQIDVPGDLKGNLSVSVTDADINQQVKGGDDIYSGILLTSDIKGYVHQPGYYFTSDVDSVQKHLDLVMLTNGWRRFKWEDVLANKWPTIKYLPEDYITLNGLVSGLSKTVLARQEVTSILEVQGQQELLSISLDTTGKIQIPGMIFYDTATIYYQFNNDKDRILTSSAIFTFNNGMVNQIGFAPDTQALKSRQAVDSVLAEKNKAIADRQKELYDERQRMTQELESVTVTAKLKSPKEIFDDEYASGLFKGGDSYDFVLEGDNLAMAALSVLNYLQGKVPGLQISVSGTMANLSWRGGTPALYLNEMQSDVQMVQSIPMSDVAYIKVFKPPFFGGGSSGAGGAIAIYTKKGQVSNKDFKGLDFAKIPGYNPPKQFYSPDYSVYDEAHIQADLRPTLYWNPFIITGSDNKRIILNFYNNDVTKRFRIVIEGISEDGRLTRIEKIFE